VHSAGRQRQIETPQALPQIFAAEADVASSEAHLPIVSRQFLQKIFSLTLLQVIAQTYIVPTRDSDFALRLEW
jgi:hypothetical protein